MPAIAFTIEDIQAEAERSKVLDPGWYSNVQCLSIDVAPSSKGDSTNYKAKLKFPSGKVIFDNFNTKATGFWIAAIAAAVNMTKAQWLVWAEAHLKSGGKVDLETELMKLQGKTFHTQLDIRIWNNEPQNEVKGYLPVDAIVPTL